MGFFQDVFGDSSKKTKDLMNNLPKQKAIGMSDYPNFEADYMSRVKDQMAGRNVGYDQNVLSSASGSYAKKAKDTYSNYTVPTINARASASGLGRSSVVSSQIRQGGQEVGTDIMNKEAELQLANEQQKKTDINNAMTRYAEVTKDYAGAKNLQSQLDYANYLQQIGLSQQADATRNSVAQKIAALGITGISAAAPMLGTSIGGMIGGLPGLSGAGKMITDFGNAVGTVGNNMNASMVNIGGKSLDVTEMEKLRQLLGIGVATI